MHYPHTLFSCVPSGKKITISHAPARRPVIYLVKGGHVQSGDEAAVEMMPGGLLGMETGDGAFVGVDGGMADVVA
jgi:hypothetical protein